MEVLEIIKQVPLPVIIFVLAILVVATVYMLYQWAKMKGLDGIRMQTYQLILKAEHIYNQSGAGKQKLKWVVSQARKLLPNWLQFIVTEEALENVIEIWFRGVKDLLDDGKINESQKKADTADTAK